jgi:hypothetical protein
VKRRTAVISTHYSTAFFEGFFILRANQELTSSIKALTFSCATLYNILAAQLFLQPQRLPHRDTMCHCNDSCLCGLNSYLYFLHMTSSTYILIGPTTASKFILQLIQGDQKVSVHLMITIQKVTSNIQSVPRHSPDIY